MVNFYSETPVEYETVTPVLEAVGIRFESDDSDLGLAFCLESQSKLLPRVATPPAHEIQTGVAPTSTDGLVSFDSETPIESLGEALESGRVSFDSETPIESLGDNLQIESSHNNFPPPSEEIPDSSRDEFQSESGTSADQSLLGILDEMFKLPTGPTK